MRDRLQTHRSRTSALLLAIALGLCAAIGSTLPAAAETYYRYQGADYARYVDLDGSDTLYVCDKERDGRPVYVQYRLIASSIYKYLYDANGSASGCSRRGGENALPVMAFRVCEEIAWWPDACSEWWGD